MRGLCRASRVAPLKVRWPSDRVSYTSGSRFTWRSDSCGRCVRTQRAPVACVYARSAQRPSGKLRAGFTRRAEARRAACPMFMTVCGRRAAVRTRRARRLGRRANIRRLVSFTRELGGGVTLMTPSGGVSCAQTRDQCGWCKAAFHYFFGGATALSREIYRRASSR